MSISEIIKDLERFEGFRGDPYVCPAGYLTIGFGRNLEANPLSMEEARVLLMNDINRAHAGAVRLFPLIHELDEVRADVLVEMVFQMGEATVRKFARFLDALARKDYAYAAAQMRDSKWWREDSPARAEALAKRMESGRRETT